MQESMNSVSWNDELTRIKNCCEPFRGQFVQLEEELDRLFETVEPITVVNHAKQVLEIVVTEICETKLQRGRGSDPLEKALNKLAKEKILPIHVLAAMLNLSRFNAVATRTPRAASTKVFSNNQVQESLIALIAILEWYLQHRNLRTGISMRYQGPPVSLSNNDQTIMTYLLMVGITLLIIAVILFIFNKTSIIQIISGDIMSHNITNHSRISKELVIDNVPKFVGT
jgi:hypothetical protein